MDNIQTLTTAPTHAPAHTGPPKGTITNTTTTTPRLLGSQGFEDTGVLNPWRDEGKNRYVYTGWRGKVACANTLLAAALKRI